MTVWCDGRFVKRLSDGKTAQSGVMVTHITVLVGADHRTEAGQCERCPNHRARIPARPSQLCGRCRSSMHDSDSSILFALTPMLFFPRRLLLLYLLCANPFIAVCDESCVDQEYFSGYGFELPVVPVVRRVFGACARCDYASYVAYSFCARWVSPLSRARVGPASKPHFAARDGTPNRAQDPQHDSNDDEDAADCVQDADPGEIANNEKNDAEDDHGRSDLAVATAADVRIPIARRLNPESRRNTTRKFRVHLGRRDFWLSLFEGAHYRH